MNSDKIMSASFAMQPLRTTVAEPFIAKAVAIDYPKQIVGKLWWHDALNTYHNFSLRAVMDLSNQGRKHLRR